MSDKYEFETAAHAGRLIDEPVYRIAPSVYAYQDMTLRDYFAGQALVGLIPGVGYQDMTDARMAEWSYKLADAMMKERTK